MKAEERVDDLMHEHSVFGLDRNSVARAIKEAEQQARKEADADIRALLWLSHEHVGLYGDDGEMQCSMCMLDFKHDPIERIVATITKQARKEALNTAMKACEDIAERFSKKDRHKWPELRHDAETGAEECAESIRALIEREGKPVQRSAENPACTCCGKQIDGHVHHDEDGDEVCYWCKWDDGSGFDRDMYHNK